jgi:hypothetical protein
LPGRTASALIRTAKLTQEGCQIRASHCCTQGGVASPLPSLIIHVASRIFNPLRAKKWGAVGAQHGVSVANSQWRSLKRPKPWRGQHLIARLLAFGSLIAPESGFL